MRKIKTVIKLQIPGGQANPAPPVGPALGQHGVNIGEFTRQFNERTKGQSGELLPVEIVVYEDRGFDFKVKTPPASYLLKKAAGIEKGVGGREEEKGKDKEPQKKPTITKKQIREIATKKMVDLNANDLESASKIIEGTAKSMGIEVR
jgi:large subunit ribosomal protein L11